MARLKENMALISVLILIVITVFFLGCISSKYTNDKLGEEAVSYSDYQQYKNEIQENYLCYSDLDCDDNKQDTEDICINAGTKDSKCENTLKRCEDGTFYNECSNTLPKFCQNGELIDDCSKCGCKFSGQECTNGLCLWEDDCFDGTHLRECSEIKPKFCESGRVLVDKCEAEIGISTPACGCPDNQFCLYGECIHYPEKQTVAIFIDEATQGKIAPEIEQYKQDIETELDVNVVILAESWEANKKPDPQIYAIKNKLKELYETKGLIGAVFIGNVPMAWFDNEGTLNGGETGDYVSDYWYMNLNGNFEDTDNDGMFNWKLNYYMEQESLPEIWVGRIKTPVEGSEGIELLKTYFYRNHQFRTKQVSNNKKILWYHPLALVEDVEALYKRAGNPEADEINLEKWYKQGAYDSVDWSNLWDVEDLDIIFDNNLDITQRLKSTSEEYLKKLKGETYEFLAYSGHGGRSNHEYNITSEDIKETKPKVNFGIFSSCSLGDYSSDDYIGGWYLFGGDGLVMFMRTFPSLGTSPNIQSLYILIDGGQLNKGKIFGEAYKYQVGHEGWQAISLLGDPTLKIRYD